MLFFAKSLTLCPDGFIKPLFSDLEITIDSGDKIGLAGPNGAGKSSLLQMIANLRPESGYWRQELTEIEKNLELEEWLIRPSKEHWELREIMGRVQDVPLEVYSRWEEIQGWDLIANIASRLPEAGLDLNILARKMGELSYGEIARAWILRFLLYPRDLYLLDEPDNHLDGPGIHLLNEWLCTTPAYVIVSHHRGFLSSITNKTWFLKAGKLSKIQASIDVLEVEKSNEATLKALQYKKQSQKAQSLEIAAQRACKKADKMENFKFKRSISKSGKVCKRDEGSGKIVRKDKFQSSASVLKDRAIQAQHKALSQKPFVEKSRQIFICPRREDVFLTCQNPVINLRSKDRLRVLGPNGSGKSTLLAKLSQPAHNLAQNIQRSLFATLAIQDQDAKNLPHSGSAWLWILKHYPLVEVSELRTWLGCFGLGSRIETADFSHLSKGERVRLLLACCLAIRPDILILDEPVNHLDIEARQLLANGLKDYTGILIFVSHDEDFAQVFWDALILDLSGNIFCRFLV
ncbi:MAG: ABC-F family ATP-binding cassette domain-containing protein [Candidatus Cloacimonetes bacterium]|nr:ABC-F family ATP-binding cassette domain-containing protein [Candidatus Cloacimonadota bacterium]